METNRNNEEKILKGIAREEALNRSEYFSDNYFSIRSLSSQSQQIHDIFNLKPKKIIEIGIGNGYTSTFLRLAGFDITTADINPNLKPDIVCSLDQLKNFTNKTNFDLAVCCEVLEHMPFEEFETNIAYLKELGNNLYLTLPNFKRSFGIGGFLILPKFLGRVNLYLKSSFLKKLPDEHFWEVGYNRSTSQNEIRKILQKYYRNVAISSYTLNPYHISFTCKNI